MCSLFKSEKEFEVKLIYFSRIIQYGPKAKIDKYFKPPVSQRLNSTFKTIVIAHGYMADSEMPAIVELKNLLLKRV